MVDDKINVLQLVEGFNLGGAEKKLWELIKYLDSSRFQVTVCTLGLGDELADYFNQLDVRLVQLPRHFRFDFTLIPKLRRVIREHDIDIVMTTLFYADVMGALVGKWGGARGVFCWETISSPVWLVPHRKWMYRLAISFADKVIAVSQATARWSVEERGVPQSKIMVIPYGVNTDLYQPGDEHQLRDELGIAREDPVVGMVARLHDQKGHRYLIQAAHRLVSSIPNLKILLVGDGPLREELEQQVRDYSLQDHFIFLGFRHDVHRLLRIFDVFTLPSMYEGLPNVVLEAMAAGLPVVATPVDGTKEAVVDGDTGILVPPRDSDALATALSSVIEDASARKRYGEQGLKRIREHFTLEKQVEGFQDLYTEYARRSTATHAIE